MERETGVDPRVPITASSSCTDSVDPFALPPQILSENHCQSAVEFTLFIDGQEAFRDPKRGRDWIKCRNAERPPVTGAAATILVVESVGIAKITDYITSALPGSVVVLASEENGAPEVSWGDLFFFYDPEGRGEPARKFPFATIVTKDYGNFDNASQLDRKGVFRLNIDVGPDVFDSLFPPGTGVDDASQLDILMPHPVYATYHWVSVLNPTKQTFETVKPLLAEAHSRHSRRYGNSRARQA